MPRVRFAAGDSISGLSSGSGIVATTGAARLLVTLLARLVIVVGLLNIPVE